MQVKTNFIIKLINLINTDNFVKLIYKFYIIKYKFDNIKNIFSKIN
jgi:hypothetical protein